MSDLSAQLRTVALANGEMASAINLGQAPASFDIAKQLADSSDVMYAAAKALEGAAPLPVRSSLPSCAWLWLDAAPSMEAVALRSATRRSCTALLGAPANAKADSVRTRSTGRHSLFRQPTSARGEARRAPGFNASSDG